MVHVRVLAPEDLRDACTHHTTAVDAMADGRETKIEQVSGLFLEHDLPSVVAVASIPCGSDSGQILS
jgi:hypothetical protein